MPHPGGFTRCQSQGGNGPATLAPPGWLGLVQTEDYPLVRSSVAPEIMLTLTGAEWREFPTGAKQGRFDSLLPQ